MAPTAEPRSRGRSKPLLVVGALGAIVFAVLATALVVRGHHPSRTPLCRGLESDVAGLGQIQWENGITKTDGTWGSALTDGVTRADPTSRQAIATAVNADSAGFEAMVADLDPSSRAQFERLRLAAVHPDDASARPGDPSTTQAIAAVRRLATASGCTLL